jgi:hypothetical protein
VGFIRYYLTDNKSLTILERLNSGFGGDFGDGFGDIGDFPFIIAITFLYFSVPLRGEHQAGFPSLYIFNASKYFII